MRVKESEKQEHDAARMRVKESEKQEHGVVKDGAKRRSFEADIAHDEWENETESLFGQMVRHLVCVGKLFSKHWTYTNGHM
jgi:hypothetical protein